MIQRPDEKLTELLKKHSFTVSAEIVPPRNGAGAQTIIDQITRLTRSGSQFMAVTKGAGGSLRGGSLPIAQMVKQDFAQPCIAHFTCRDLLPEEVENQLIDHHLFGIRNILALRGDPPQGVENWKNREGSHEYAYQLVHQIRQLNQGQYLERAGFKVEAREATDFCIGVAAYPDHPNEKERVEFFKLKVDAGAEFAITQMLFDPESYARFVELCDKAGARIPVLPGTRLLKSKDQALRMAKRFDVAVSAEVLECLPTTDAEAKPERSLEAFFTLTAKLKAYGAPGMHVFVLSDTALAEKAIQGLRPQGSTNTKTAQAAANGV